MIFVSFGTQPHNFKALCQIVNEIDSTYKVIVQLGESENTITRTNTKVFKYSDQYNKYVDECDILITHGGVGSIMDGLERQKKIITIARLSKYQEHIDDHQLEVTNKLASENYCLKYERGCNINDVITQTLNTDFVSYESNTQNFCNELSKIILED